MSEGTQGNLHNIHYSIEFNDEKANVTAVNNQNQWITLYS